MTEHVDALTSEVIAELLSQGRPVFGVNWVLDWLDLKRAITPAPGPSLNRDCHSVLRCVLQSLTSHRRPRLLVQHRFKDG